MDTGMEGIDPTADISETLMAAVATYEMFSAYKVAGFTVEEAIALIVPQLIEGARQHNDKN